MDTEGSQLNAGGRWESNKSKLRHVGGASCRILAQGKRKASPIPIRPRKARGITEKTQWGPWGALRAQVRRTKCGAALRAGSGRGIAGGFDKGDAGVVGGWETEGEAKE